MRFLYFPASTGKLYVATYDKPFYVPERVNHVTAAGRSLALFKNCERFSSPPDATYECAYVKRETRSKQDNRINNFMEVDSVDVDLRDYKVCKVPLVKR